MKKAIAKKWVAALRSGKYKQGIGRLEYAKKQCCLGVLCNLALVEGVCVYLPSYCSIPASFDGEEILLPDSVRRWAGMKTHTGQLDNQESLMALNDTGRTFKEIGDIIEKNYKKL